MKPTAKIKIHLPSVSSLLGVLFVGLKLTNHITWPWIWVLAPFWIPVVACLILLLVAAILVIIADSN